MSVIESGDDMPGVIGLVGQTFKAIPPAAREMNGIGRAIQSGFAHDVRAAEQVIPKMNILRFNHHYKAAAKAGQQLKGARDPHEYASLAGKMADHLERINPGGPLAKAVRADAATQAAGMGGGMKTSLLTDRLHFKRDGLYPTDPESFIFARNHSKITGVAITSALAGAGAATTAGIVAAKSRG